MTDKQIITKSQMIMRIAELSANLIAKEQECEELKKIIDEAKNSKLDLKSFLVGEAVQNEYEQQLDQLKASLDEKNDLLQKLGISATGEFKRIKYYVDKLVAENEELTTINARLLGRLEVDETDTQKEEIKEILQ